MGDTINIHNLERVQNTPGLSNIYEFPNNTGEQQVLKYYPSDEHAVSKEELIGIFGPTHGPFKNIRFDALLSKNISKRDLIDQIVEDAEIPVSKEWVHELNTIGIKNNTDHLSKLLTLQSHLNDDQSDPLNLSFNRVLRECLSYRILDIASNELYGEDSRLIGPREIRLFKADGKYRLGLVMDKFPEGSTILSRKLKDKKSPLAMRSIEIVNNFATLAKQMSLAHKLGILHRDIELKNLLVHDKNIYLFDWGISLVGKHTLNNPMGTFTSMAPERFFSRFEITEKVDNYSLSLALLQTLLSVDDFVDVTSILERHNYNDYQFDFQKSGQKIKILMENKQTELLPDVLFLIQEKLGLNINDASTLTGIFENLLHTIPERRPEDLEVEMLKIKKIFNTPIEA